MRSSIAKAATADLNLHYLLPLSACVPLALRCPLPQDGLRKVWSLITSFDSGLATQDSELIQEGWVQ
ncbi:hypothetical protein [Rufibacter roseus]|uniref:Uncharacterized protein n=1 Tax=Rufibacter roseus TaxID=1567108 RepID=A0ABW2DL90_9BACT|nr:hypothetical protein [Rufibacter roseus]